MRRRSSNELEALLIASTTEALAIARGDLAPAREVTHELTARDVEVAPPPAYDAVRVHDVRKGMRVS
jgi:hypothetical protein